MVDSDRRFSLQAIAHLVAHLVSLPSTRQSTNRTSKVNMNDAVSLFVEFLEVVIHSSLFNRKLYPEGIFTLKKKYSVPVHISLYPELNKYINEVLFVVKKCLDCGELKQVEISFHDPAGQPVEKIIIQLNYFDKTGDTSVVDPYLLDLRGSFRSFLLKLAVSTSFVSPLPIGSTFKILLYTNESTVVMVNEDANLQRFPLIGVNLRDSVLPNREITPVKTIEHPLMSINVYIETKAH